MGVCSSNPRAHSRSKVTSPQTMFRADQPGLIQHSLASIRARDVLRRKDLSEDLSDLKRALTAPRLVLESSELYTRRKSLRLTGLTVCP